jgi:hypothetical protein
MGLDMLEQMRSGLGSLLRGAIGGKHGGTLKWLLSLHRNQLMGIAMRKLLIPFRIHKIFLTRSYQL